jgi:hypothetical protein
VFFALVLPGLIPFLLLVILGLLLLGTKAIRIFFRPIGKLFRPLWKFLRPILIDLLVILFIPFYLIYKLLLLGTKAIRRLFRRFRRGRRLLSEHKEEEE